MTLSESVSTCLRKYFVIQGRASLSEFWWFQLIWVVAYLSIIVFSGNEPIVFFFYWNNNLNCNPFVYCGY